MKGFWVLVQLPPYLVGVIGMDEHGRPVDDAEGGPVKDADGGLEGKLVPYALFEARRDFTERNGGLDEGGFTDVEMLKVAIENDNLSKLIEQGDASPANIERYERNEALIDAYYRMLVPDAERRAEILAEAEANAEISEDFVDELLEDAGITVRDGVIVMDDNLVEFPRSE